MKDQMTLVIFFFQDNFRSTVQEDTTTIYLAAVAAAFLFFGSIIVHEMGHALVARREGIPVEGIDLFLFGGLMHMRSEPRTPGAEFRVAAAGPAATVLVIAVSAGGGLIAEGSDGFWESARLTGEANVSVVMALVSTIALMNVLILMFNLVPAYPLDGGRIARAAVWKLTGDRTRGTVIAARLGQLLGFALIALGAYDS